MTRALEVLSRKAVLHRVAKGLWQRPHHAVLVTHNGAITPVQRQWIAVLATGGVLGGLSAAEAGGLRGFADAPVHILVRAHDRPRPVPSEVIVHRTSVLDDVDILGAGRPPRTKAARSIVDAAQWARSDQEARALIAAAYQQRIVADRDVHEVLSRLRRARRRALITQTATDAAGGAHSLAEIDFVTLCWAHGLPEPALQAVRRDASGRRRYLDAVFEEWKVHVEIDGGQHLEVRSAWADMRRDNELWISGMRLLRFPAWALRHDPTTVLDQLRSALTAAGWTPDR